MARGDACSMQQRLGPETEWTADDTREWCTTYLYWLIAAPEPCRQEEIWKKGSWEWLYILLRLQKKRNTVFPFHILEEGSRKIKKQNYYYSWRQEYYTDTTGGKMFTTPPKKESWHRPWEENDKDTWQRAKQKIKWKTERKKAKKNLVFFFFEDKILLQYLSHNVPR